MKGKCLTALIMAAILSLSCMTVKASDMTNIEGDNSQYSQTENENSGSQDDTKEQSSGGNDIPEEDSQSEETVQDGQQEEAQPVETGEELSLYAASGEMMEMPTGQKMMIVLAEDTTYRWNADGDGGYGQKIHLMTANGPNKYFRLDTTEDSGYYGIKHILEGGTDRYVNVDQERMDENSILNLWDTSSCEKDSRKFAFYDAGKDAVGNQLYYIQIKSSNLWVGLQGSEKPGQWVNVAQVSQPNRKKWMLSPTPAPLKGGETRLFDEEGDRLGGEEKETIFTMSPVGFEREANVGSDTLPANGNGIHLYFMGTSSKIKAYYNETYSAYELEPLNLDENKLNEGSNWRWDVKGANANEGQVIHIWDRINDHPSQLWRFIKVAGTENHYRIYNANSGLYLNLESDEDHDNVKLVQSRYSRDWELNFLNRALVSAKSAQWMSKLPDNLPLSAINIPGANEAGASNMMGNAAPQASAERAQQLYIYEQLRMGVRALDIQCAGDDSSDPVIVHGDQGAHCQKKADGNGSSEALKLSDVMQYCRDFLTQHPSETIILSVKADSGNHTPGNVAKAMERYINDGNYLIWDQNYIPTLGQARGKIVLMRRYTFEGASISTPDWKFGFDLSNWDDQDYQLQKNAQKLYDHVSGEQDGSLFNIRNQVWVQDYFNAGSPEEKMEYVNGTISHAQINDITYKPQTEQDKEEGITDTRGYLFNYTTTADSLSSARNTAQLIRENANLKKADKKKPLGIVMMNYVDRRLAEQIYETNTGFHFGAEVKFPASGYIEYGMKLEQAELLGYETSIEGDFVFDEEDRHKYPQIKTPPEEYHISFVPKDPAYGIINDEENKVPIYVKSKEIQVGVADQRITFGTPFHVDDVNVMIDSAMLAAGDQLTVKVRLEDQNGNEVIVPENGILDAGTYRLTPYIADNNPNYTLDRFGAGTLTVAKKKIGLKWENTTERTTNDGKEVTASVTDMVKGFEDCTAAVEGGKEQAANPGMPDGTPRPYTATVTGLKGKDAGNYELPEEASVNYYIDRNKSQVIFPERAELTYGQSLGEAVFAGGEGDGIFRFVKKNECPHAGQYKEEYEVIFIPDDPKHYASAVQKVNLTVRPKAIDIDVSDKIITFGDKTPSEFSYTIDVSALAAGDTAESLDISMKVRKAADRTEVTGQDILESGLYCLTPYINNGDYTCSSDGKDGILTVKKRVVQLSWTSRTGSLSDIVYNGEPAGVSAKITNIVEQYDCDVIVEGGNETEPGYRGTDQKITPYTAEAVGLSDPDHYMLPEEAAVDYYILRDNGQVEFPKKAVMTYGESLAQAKFSGGAGNGIFRFVTGSIVPDAGEYDGDEGFFVEFIPNDPSQSSPGPQRVPLTVREREISVKPVNRELTFGDTLPELTAADTVVDTQALAPGETLQDLGITVEITDEKGNKVSGIVPAGQYTIQAAGSNKNYKINDSKGVCTVYRRIAELQWTAALSADGDLSDMVYNGAPAGVEAKVTNIVTDGEKAYKCDVTVEGGNEKEPSFSEKEQKMNAYIATAAELSDSKNYALPRENSVSYYIRRANSEDTVFPEKAELTYAEFLESAKFTGGSGAGTFRLIRNPKAENVSIMPDAGIYDIDSASYLAEFIPDDPSHKRLDAQPVRLVVKQREISAQTADRELVFGGEIPALTEEDVSIDTASLPAGQRKKDVQIQIKVTDGNGEEVDGIVPAGQYVIRGEALNPNYVLKGCQAVCTVYRRVAQLEWTSASGSVTKIMYTGDSAQITAHVANIVTAPDTVYSCDVAVEGGDAVSPSWNKADQKMQPYTARAWALSDERNYVLPAENSIDYYILRSDSNDVVFPERAVLTYGQPLSSARFIGGGGAGTFRFLKASERPDSGEYKEAFRMFEVEFIPDDDAHRQPTVQKVPLYVEQREITVRPYSHELTFGEKLPELTEQDVYVDGNVLQNGERKDDLDIELKITGKNGEEVKGIVPAGRYTIQASIKNRNYTAKDNTGICLVNKRVAELKWTAEASKTNDLTNIVYTGGPAGVKAEVTNIVKDNKKEYECNVTVRGGGEKEPSWDKEGNIVNIYTASAFALSDPDNYILPDDCSVQYYIQRNDSENVIFPEIATLTYGQSFEKAKFTERSGNGTFELIYNAGGAAADAGLMPNAGIYYSGAGYSVVFKPTDNKTREIVSQPITLVVNPKEVGAEMADRELTFGEPIPVLTEEDILVDKTALVNGQIKEELKIAVTVEDRKGEAAEGIMPAGRYVMQAQSRNPNYVLTGGTAVCTVNKRTVELNWSDTSNIVYTGEPAGVTAEVGNIVSDGTTSWPCTVTVEGGNAYAPSWNAGGNTMISYTATATALSDQDNYMLPSDKSIKYYIRRKDSEDMEFPDKAVLTYGETLAEAQFLGGAGDGIFRFVNGSAMLNAGTYSEHFVEFIPNDPSHSRPKTKIVPVTVKKKEIAVRPYSQELTFGDQIPELGETDTFVDMSTLPQGRSKADLKITVKVTDVKGNVVSGIVQAGSYTIQAESGNANYIFKDNTAICKVNRRVAELEWTARGGNVSNIVYDPYHTAEVKAKVVNPVVVGGSAGIIYGSDVTVEGGSEKEPSWDENGNLVRTYRAEAVRLEDPHNFALPEDHAIDYYIRRENSQDVTFPKKASLTYGEALDEARFTGGSGAGKFKLINASTEEDADTGVIPDAGIYEDGYWVVFIPEDQNHAKPAASKIRLEVEKKKVTIQADIMSGTYGELTADNIDSDNIRYRYSLADGESLADKDKGKKLSEVLGLTVKVSNPIYNRQENEAPAHERFLCSGQYRIAENVCAASNYDVKALPGILSVGAKEIAFTWTGQKERVYDGKESNVKAEAVQGTVCPGDSVNIVVLGGSQKNAGTYQAYAVCTDNANYKLRLGLEGLFGFKGLVNSNEWRDSRLCKYTIKKRLLSVTADNVSCVYGDIHPKFTWSVDKSAPLAEGDTPESLKLTLKAVDESGYNIRQRSKAGKYDIVLEHLGNQNYTFGYRSENLSDATPEGFTKGCFTIEQRTVKIVWHGFEPRDYDGNPSNVTADAEGLAFDDILKVTVTGGTEAEPGTHKATAEKVLVITSTGAILDDQSYKLPDNASIEYTINAVFNPDDPNPDETKPEETDSDETRPDDTKPEETSPDDTKPDEIKPEDTNQGVTNPDDNSGGGGSSQTQETQKQNTAVQSGDTFNLYGMLMLCILSGAAAVVLVLRKNRKKA